MSSYGALVTSLLICGHSSGVLSNDELKSCEILEFVAMATNKKRIV